MISGIPLCPDDVDCGSKANPLNDSIERFPSPMVSKPWNIPFPRDVVVSVMTFVEHCIPNTTRDWASEEEVVVSLHLSIAKQALRV